MSSGVRAWDGRMATSASSAEATHVGPQPVRDKRFDRLAKGMADAAAYVVDGVRPLRRLK